MTQQELQELKEHVNLQLKHLLCDNCRVEACGKYQEIVCEQKYNQCKRYLECIEAYEQLQEYKELKKEDRLQILPCKPGDTIYKIVYEEGDCLCPNDEECPVNRCIDCEYDSKGEYSVHSLVYDPNRFNIYEFGTRYFTTEQAAKNRIAELEAKSWNMMILSADLN